MRRLRRGKATGIQDQILALVWVVITVSHRLAGLNSTFTSYSLFWVGVPAPVIFAAGCHGPVRNWLLKSEDGRLFGISHSTVLFMSPFPYLQCLTFSGSLWRIQLVAKCCSWQGIWLWVVLSFLLKRGRCVYVFSSQTEPQPLVSVFPFCLWNKTQNRNKQKTEGI